MRGPLKVWCACRDGVSFLCIKVCLYRGTLLCVTHLSAGTPVVL